MATYHVNVLTKDHTLAASHLLDVAAPQSMWSKLAKLAWTVGENGGQIRVTDQTGKLVVLVGVNSARRAVAPSLIPPAPAQPLYAFGCGTMRI